MVFAMSKSSESLSRRQFVKGVGLAGMATTLVAQPVAEASVTGSSSRSRKAKNLIFLVVDGMGIGTYSLAHYWSLRNLGKNLNWTDLYRQPGIRRAMQDTASASSPVTDSAAAASAWGCACWKKRASLRCWIRRTDGSGKGWQRWLPKWRRRPPIPGCPAGRRLRHRYLW